MSVKDRVHQLNEYIAQGKILEAMEEFYTEDIVMQENLNPPTAGREANIEREKQFLAQVKEFKAYNVLGVGVGEDISFIESELEFINTQGQHVKLTQVTVQRWRGDRIWHERFYYDSATK